MKNPPPPLHSRYPPRKLLLFLLSNTHPAIGVMDAIRRLLNKGDKNKGDKNTTRLINSTDEDMEIREFRGIMTGENNFFSKITVKARQQTDIDATKYGGDDSRGGQLSYLRIFCGRSFLRSSEGDLQLPGEEFINFETVTIKKLEDQNSTGVVDQNSTGVVNYEVKFQPQDRVLKAMTLDPSKLFSGNIVKDPETSLLHKVLEFWPRTFTNFNSKDDLVKTVGDVNDLMVQAKKYNALRVLETKYSADRSTGEDAKVMEKVKEKVREMGREVRGKVSELNKNNLCAAKEGWYRPLFQGIRFPQPPMAQVEVKQDFETAIKVMLEPTDDELDALKEQLKATIN